MAIRTILVPLDGSEESRTALSAAVQLAGDHGAHIDVMHVRANPKDAVPLLGEGMSGAVIEDIVTATEREAEKRAVQARAIYEDICQSAALTIADKPGSRGGASISWREASGREDETIALHGRLADVIVLGRLTEDSSVSHTMALNAALVDTGRPVLIVPPADAKPFGKRIAVSWNGSAEAGRAVAAAMPEIRKAEAVLILTVDMDQSGNAMAMDLRAYLAWHGVEAEVETTPVIDTNVGETVLSKCVDWHADLLVMGAYTHSRLRQLIMGGVTRHVLGHSPVPVILVH